MYEQEEKGRYFNRRLDSHYLGLLDSSQQRGYIGVRDKVAESAFGYRLFYAYAENQGYRRMVDSRCRFGLPFDEELEFESPRFGYISVASHFNCSGNQQFHAETETMIFKGKENTLP